MSEKVEGTAGETSYAFRSLKAGGRLLQPAKGAGAHTVAGYEWAPGDLWKSTPEGFINEKTRKELGWRAMDLRALAVGDIRAAEREQQRLERILQSRINAAEIKAVDSERRASELLEAARKQQSKHTSMLEELKQQLEERGREAAMLKARLEQSHSLVHRLEFKLADAAADKGLEDERATVHQRRIQMLEEQLMKLHETNTTTVQAMERSHQTQLEYLKKERDAAVQEMQEDLQAQLAAKQEEVAELTDSNSRLDAALQSIKGEIDRAATPPQRNRDSHASLSLSADVTMLRMSLLRASNDDSGLPTLPGPDAPMEQADADDPPAAASSAQAPLSWQDSASEPPLRQLSLGSDPNTAPAWSSGWGLDEAVLPRPPVDIYSSPLSSFGKAASRTAPSAGQPTASPLHSASRSPLRAVNSSTRAPAAAHSDAAADSKGSAALSRPRSPHSEAEAEGEEPQDSTAVAMPEPEPEQGAADRGGENNMPVALYKHTFLTRKVAHNYW